MIDLPKEPIKVRKPPTYFYYLVGLILLFCLGFVGYYFGYHKYFQKQLDNLINQNQNSDLNIDFPTENINRNQAANYQKIYIDSPQEEEVIGNPVVIKGRAEVFEASFNISIKDANGEILGQTAAKAKEGQVMSPYEVNLSYATSTTEFGLIEAFDYSAKDGSVQDLVSVKIKFASFGQKDETADLSAKDLATADWKTYTNDKYGFEFKYPKEWHLDSDRMSPQKIEDSEIGSDNAPIHFGVYSKAGNDIKNDIIDFGNIDYQINNSKRVGPDSKINLSGIEFNEYDLIDYGRYEGDSAGNVILVVSPEMSMDNKSLYIVFQWEEKPGGKEMSSNNSNDFLKIISTFKSSISF